MESSQTRDQTCVPCIGRQILIHCTTREVLFCSFTSCVNIGAFCIFLSLVFPYLNNNTVMYLLGLLWRNKCVFVYEVLSYMPSCSAKRIVFVDHTILTKCLFHLIWFENCCQQVFVDRWTPHVSVAWNSNCTPSFFRHTILNSSLLFSSLI